MNDITKFKRMTKPLKFRKLRLFFQSVGLTYKVGIERIKYLINYILYKLNILKRYSYRTNYEEVYELPHTIEPKMVTTKDFNVLLHMTVVLLVDVDLDYFYKYRKDGSKKIVYYMKDMDDKKLFARTTIKDLYLKINDEFVLMDNRMQKYTCVGRTELKPFSESENITKLWELRTFNLYPVKYLCDTLFLGKDLTFDSLTEAMLDYYYEVSARHFLEKLQTMSLDDIEVKQNDRQETP